MTKDLPLLSSATCRAYCERLGLAAPRVDLAGLTALQAAHLRALPFHNLQLLAGDGADPGPPAIEAAVDGALQGVGGTCHLLTPPFVALLRSLGFDAWLAAASVGAPGDHIVGVVRMEERLYLCDVGNGHPYLRPLALGDEGDEWKAFGWSFVLERHPSAGGTHRLRRRLPDGAWKTVYSVDSRSVDHASFAAIVRAHHTRVGYGPFLTGLRAVRIAADVMLTLRDDMLERHHASGRWVGRRRIGDASAFERVLDRCFGLSRSPCTAALAVWRRRSREASVSAAVQAPGDQQLRVLCTVGVTDRPGALRRLGAGLLRAWSRAGLPAGAVGLLALDNGCAPGSLMAEAEALRTEGLPTRVVPTDVAARWHARLYTDRLVADPPGTTRCAIATIRALQVAAVWEHLGGAPWAEGLPGVSENGALAVWMVDDDLELARLERGPGGLTLRPVDDILLEMCRLRRHYPDVSVVVGGTVGCPPVPGFQVLASQLVDLADHLAKAATSDPAAPYRPVVPPRDRSDYYYDHSDAGPAYEVGPFPWEPIDGGERTVRAALLEHVRAAQGLESGAACTRLLVHTPAMPIAPTTARGGNALFLDLDALFAVPTPALRCADGVVTRRGDTVWAELMAEGSHGVVVQAPLPLLHRRRSGDHNAPLADAERDPGAMRRFAAAQLRGITVARLVAARRRGELATGSAILAERAARVRGSLAAAVAASQEIATWAAMPTAWWHDDTELRAALYEAVAVVSGVLAACAELGADEPAEVAAELERFAAELPRAVARWQELWR